MILLFTEGLSGIIKVISYSPCTQGPHYPVMVEEVKINKISTELVSDYDKETGVELALP